MVWEFIKSVYYFLFCTHQNYVYDKYFTVEYIYGYIEVEVFISRTCEQCEASEEVMISKHEGSSVQMEKVINNLKSKGFRNVEDLI